MRGAIPPLPQYVFMAWCLVKAQGQLYLYLRHWGDKVLAHMFMNTLCLIKETALLFTSHFCPVSFPYLTVYKVENVEQCPKYCSGIRTRATVRGFYSFQATSWWSFACRSAPSFIILCWNVLKRRDRRTITSWIIRPMCACACVRACVWRDQLHMKRLDFWFLSAKCLPNIRTDRIVWAGILQCPPEWLNSMQQNPIWEAVSHSATKNLPTFYGT
jgi:hypothetical protein